VFHQVRVDIPKPHQPIPNNL